MKYWSITIQYPDGDTFVDIVKAYTVGEAYQMFQFNQFNGLFTDGFVVSIVINTD